MIYLDAAATTFQKPPAVAAAVKRAMETMSSPGRGGYSAAMEAAEENGLNFYSSPLSVFELCAKVAPLLA